MRQKVFKASHVLAATAGSHLSRKVMEL